MAASRSTHLRRALACTLVLISPGLTYALARPYPPASMDGSTAFSFLVLGVWSLAASLAMWWARTTLEDAKLARVLALNVVLLDVMHAGLVAVVVPRSLPGAAVAFATHAAISALLVLPTPQVPSPRPAVGAAVHVVIGSALFLVLLVVAYQGWRALRKRAALVETIHMVGEIRNAQEVFRSETGGYANVSAALAANQSTNHFALYPQAPLRPGRHAFSWGVDCPKSACRLSWLVIPVLADRVVYGYSTVAGVAAAPPPATIVVDGRELTWSPPGQEWFLVTAVGDPMGDGSYTTVVGGSLWPELRIDNP